MAEKKKDPGPSVKDDELYEKLRDEGNTGLVGDEYNRNPNQNETSNN